MRHEGCHRARREGRRQRAALVFPGTAFRQQQALAEHRPQHPDAGRGAGIVLPIVDQHMPDRVRRIEDEARTVEEPAFDDVVLIGPIAPAGDRIGADRRQPLQRAHRFQRRAAASAAPAGPEPAAVAGLRLCSWPPLVRDRRCRPQVGSEPQSETSRDGIPRRSRSLIGEPAAARGTKAASADAAVAQNRRGHWTGARFAGITERNDKQIRSALRTAASGPLQG